MMVHLVAGTDTTEGPIGEVIGVVEDGGAGGITSMACSPCTVKANGNDDC
jgi:hypothetical protein